MNLPDDQLRVPLEAAIATLRRFDDVTQVGDEAYAALARAKYHLLYLLALLDERQHPRT